MTTDKTPATLATAKHGGCVQLKDGQHVLVLREMRAQFTDAGSPARTAALDAAIAALSAQPSPGGQGDAPEIEQLRALVSSILSTVSLGHQKGPYAYAGEDFGRYLAEAARDCRTILRVLSDIAARQPVGQIVGYMDPDADFLLPRADGCVLMGKVEVCLWRTPSGKYTKPLYATPPAPQPAQVYLDGLDRALGEAIDQRDRYHEVADDLAGHIAAITGVDIGEHSSANFPWQNAIEAAEEYKPAQAVDLPYSLDADPAGIRARVAECITGTLMVGAQGHTPPPAGHWAEPFWQAARADAGLQVKMREALWAAAKSLRTIADSTKDTEFLETASEIRAYANSRANCAEQALTDSQAVGNG